MNRKHRLLDPLERVKSEAGIRNSECAYSTPAFSGGVSEGDLSLYMWQSEKTPTVEF